MRSSSLYTPTLTSSLFLSLSSQTGSHWGNGQEDVWPVLHCPDGPSWPQATPTTTPGIHQHTGKSTIIWNFLWGRNFNMRWTGLCECMSVCLQPSYQAPLSFLSLVVQKSKGRNLTWAWWYTWSGIFFLHKYTLKWFLQFGSGLINSCLLQLYFLSSPVGQPRSTGVYHLPPWATASCTAQETHWTSQRSV